MATENEYVNNLFQEIEMPNENKTFNENNSEKLPIEIFQEIESELRYVLNNSESDDEIDEPIQFIQNIVETIKKDLDDVLERKTSPHILTRIFAALLSAYGANTQKSRK